MANIFRAFLIVLVAYCSVGQAAEIDIHQTAAFDIAGAPIDVAVSSDGKSVYVLTEVGDILLYSPDGQLKGRVHAGDQVDFLAAGHSENQLFIGSTGSKTLRAISLEFTYEIDTSGAPFQGLVDAPVTIVVFMDYQCPYCAHLKPLLEKVLSNYSGQVKIVYKQFPLKMHKAALTAATAALVAFDGGKFEALHNLMEADYNTLDNEKILDKVSSLGFDREDFQRKMADSNVLKRIQKDIEDGRQAGVSGIPSVFINGRRLQKRTLEGFQDLIDQVLEKLRHTQAAGGF